MSEQAEPTLRRRFAEWRGRNGPLCDTFVAVGVTGAAVALVEWYDWRNGPDPLPYANRSGAYAAAVSVFGSLLGFVVTSMSILTTWVSQPTPKMHRLRRLVSYSDLWGAFSGGIVAISFALVVSAIGIVVDREKQPLTWWYVLPVFGCSLASLRAYRCYLLLITITQYVAGPIKEGEPDPAP